MALSPEDVAARARDLYGGDPLRAEGVLHVASAWRAPDGSLRSLVICAETPRSETDAFVLALARARADAIVTTGRILRLEPALRHAPPDVWAAGLRAWRREVLGRRDPPRVAVLTRRRDLDLGHPVLRTRDRGLVYTTRQTALALGGAAEARGVEVVAADAPDLPGLIRHLRAQLGCRTVLVEAGARSSAALYRDGGRVDELLLSLYGGPPPPDTVQGPALPDDRAIAGAGLILRSEHACVEASGPWVFRRYRR